MFRYVSRLILLIGVVFSLLCPCNNAYAAYPYAFTNGTTSDATQVNADLDYFENKFSTSSGHNHDGLNSRKIDLSGYTWTGGLVATTYGGLYYDNSAATIGSVLYATKDISGNVTFVNLGAGTLGQALLTNGVGAAPSWGSSGAKDLISRGFELVYGTTTSVTVNPGVLYNNTTLVNTTTTTPIDITVSGNYLTGARYVSQWIYVGVKDASTIKLFATKDGGGGSVALTWYADTSGNTAGTGYYLKNGTDYYRCIGAIRLNATESGEIEKFFQQGNTIMWDVPVELTTTSKTSWFALSCSVAMPSISTCGIFGLSANETNAVSGVWIRPTGSTWSSNPEDGVGAPGTANGDHATTGQRICMTDASQSIDYINTISDNIFISLEGYYLNIR